MKRRESHLKMAWVWSVILFCVTVCSGYHIGNVSQKCVDDTVVFLTELEEAQPSRYAVLKTFQLASKSLIPPVPPIILPDSKQGVYMAQCFTHTPPDFSVIISLFVCSLLIAIPLVATVYVGVVQCRQWKEIDPWSGTALSTNFNHYGTLMPNGSATTNNNGCIFPEATDSCKSKEDKRTKSNPASVVTAVVQAVNSSAAGLLGAVNAGGNYASLNGIRILSLLWIISGHNLQFSTWNMDNYKRWRERVANNPLYVVAYSGPVYLSVDTFLLLGGLLSAKSFLALVQRADDTISLRLVASFLFKRLRRVQPLHIFIVCLTISVFSMVQNNSYDSITHNELQHCRKYWWSNVLLINNLLPVVDICVPWSWYLSVDFQYYTTTPLLVFLYRRNKFAMSALATILLLISILASAFITATVQLPVHQPTTLDYASFYEYYYNKPWTRYGPYLIGVFTGIFLNTKKSHLLKHQWQAALGWVSSVIVIAALIALSYVLRDVPDQPSIPHAAYQGLHRTLFGLCVAWVILACEEGYGGFINKMMSLKLWVPLSNISYACYMIHPLIIILYNGKQDTPTHYNDINFMYLFLGHTVLSGLVGYVLTVLIEKPYMFLKGLRG
ncbi:hypothetical protein COCON_G00171330 [Conger conger]|uniref:Acyltransferase 3 domain-containing protein n=1 Tax=Conger conger TaxID=82655 RepID=A0A9Q1HU70_CONCO|nr:hypothetical protein COCON_G00171330 [Conger conger]